MKSSWVPGRLAARKSRKGKFLEYGAIYQVNLDPTAGHEQAGKRPVLVVSPTKFNKATGLCWVIPITNKGKSRRIAGFVHDLPPGTKTTGRVLVHQIRTLDLSARGADFIEDAPVEFMTKVSSVLKAILEG
ncbi:hypothetical protein GFK91_30640 (plasmid) [Roseibium aggregatum]|nr:hypothetical protein GFK91_30640 [Roseibium aggregatum]